MIGASVLFTIFWPERKRLLATAHEGMTPPRSAAPASAPLRRRCSVEASRIAQRPNSEKPDPQAGRAKAGAGTLAAAPTLDSYETGYAEARDELEDALDYIRFDHVRPVRLKSAEAVRITRRSSPRLATSSAPTGRERSCWNKLLGRRVPPPALNERVMKQERPCGTCWTTVTAFTHC